MAAAKRIDGKAFAADISQEVRQRTEKLAARGVTPGLAVIIVGEDPASQVYVRNKGRTAEACGFRSFRHAVDADITQQALLDLIGELNTDEAVHGILVQLPLPGHLDEEVITQAVLPAKDVDGFHVVNVGRLATGNIDRAFLPCTPAGCMRMIENELGPDLSGLNACVIGRSNIVGKPMAALLLRANATVTVCHSRTPDLPGLARQADILVAAVGRPQFVGGDWIKPGAVVIDVGINRIETEDGQGRLVGDVDFDAASELAAAITPVPGGVGPMTIAMLMVNTLRSAERAADR